MVFPSSAALPSSMLAARLRPVLELLLAGLAMLLFAGVGEMVPSVRPARSTARSTMAVETMMGRVALSAPPWTAMDHDTDPALHPIDVAPIHARRTMSIDRYSPKLSGPPDRQPQATLVERYLSRGQGEEGEARSYLEQTAAARWLVPRNRVILAWDETSGYGAVEASRADH